MWIQWTFVDYYDANSFNLDICAFADFNDFMRHFSITIVPYPVNCDRRHGNHLFKPPADSGLSPNIQICHACLQVSVLWLKTIRHLQRFADSQRDNWRSKTLWIVRDSAIHQHEYNSVVSEQHQWHTNTTTNPQERFIIKILSIKCNSIKGNTKNCEFRALLQPHDPHVILGCESKIDYTFPTYSLFPSHYTEVHRKDLPNTAAECFVQSGQMSWIQRRMT